MLDAKVLSITFCAVAVCVYASTALQKSQLSYPTKHGKGTSSPGRNPGESPVNSQTCPASSLVCSFNERCCEKTCCPATYPNCYDAFGVTSCITNEGLSVCTSKEGTSDPGTLCSDLTCCIDGTYNRCAGDYCVDKEGFVPCVNPKKAPGSVFPGVLCNIGGTQYCCANPLRCCATSENGCCETGAGAPLQLDPLLSGSPGSVPGGASKGYDAKEKEPQGIEQATEGAPKDEQSGGSEKDEGKRTGGTCFPAHATVQLKDGSRKRMDTLQVGELVRVSFNQYSEVFMWTHQDHRYHGSNYIRLKTENGHAVTATTGHMIHVCSGTETKCKRKLIPVENVNIGQSLFIMGKQSEEAVPVVDKETITSKGLYNPQTLHGDIVVDGVLSSCYTRFIPFRMAHGALTPLRAIHEMFSKPLKSFAQIS